MASAWRAEVRALVVSLVVVFVLLEVPEGGTGETERERFLLERAVADADGSLADPVTADDVSVVGATAVDASVAVTVKDA